MARTIHSPLVLPRRVATQGAAITGSATAGPRSIRNALVTEYEQCRAEVVAQSATDGGNIIDCAIGEMIEYQVKVGRADGQLHNWRVLVVIGDSDGDNEITVVFGAAAAVIIVPMGGGDCFVDLAVEHTAEVLTLTFEVTLADTWWWPLSSVSVCPLRDRIVLPAGPYSDSLIPPDLEPWMSDEACTVAHYWELVRLAGALWERAFGQVLSAAYSAGFAAWADMELSFQVVPPVKDAVLVVAHLGTWATDYSEWSDGPKLVGLGWQTGRMSVNTTEVTVKGRFRSICAWWETVAMPTTLAVVYDYWQTDLGANIVDHDDIPEEVSRA